MSQLNLNVMGPPVLLIDGKEVVGRVSDKAMALITYLAVTRTAASRSLIAGLLWSDLSEERARGNLRTTLFRLRSLLPDHVEANRALVWLADSVDTDVAAIETAEPSKLAELYRGELFQGIDLVGAELFESWRASEALQIRSAVISRVAGAAEEALAEGEGRAGDQCVTLCRRLTAIDPWNERVQRLLMSALARSRGRTPAREHFEQFAHRLRSELAVTPEEETLELASTLGLTAEVIDLREHAKRNDPVPLVRTVSVDSDSQPLIARSRQLDVLLGLLVPERRGDQTVIVSGGAGTGKSALLRAFMREAEGLGSHVIHASCGQRRGIMTGIATDLVDVAQSAPAVVVIDDLHLASAVVVAEVLDLAVALIDTGASMLLAHRNESSAMNRALRAALVRLDDMGSHRMAPLGPFTRDDVAALVAVSTGEDAAERISAVADRVWSAARGLPSYSVAWLEHLAESGESSFWDTTASEQRPFSRVPGFLRDVIWARVDALGPDAVQIATIAAAIGERFGLEALVSASAAAGRDEEETLTAIDGLIGADVLREPDEATCLTFAQPLVAWSLVHDSGWLFRHQSQLTYEKLGVSDRSNAAVSIA